MATVFIPPQLRALCQGQRSVVVPGKTVGELIDGLDSRFAGISTRLLTNDELKPGLSVTVDHDVCTAGVDCVVSDVSEVHFLPAIGGG